MAMIIKDIVNDNHVIISKDLVLLGPELIREEEKDFTQYSKELKKKSNAEEVLRGSIFIGSGLDLEILSGNKILLWNDLGIPYESRVKKIRRCVKQNNSHVRVVGGEDVMLG
jgi:hypothetical protein